jgi:hypothetical protein
MIDRPERVAIAKELMPLAERQPGIELRLDPDPLDMSLRWFGDHDLQVDMVATDNGRLLRSYSERRTIVESNAAGFDDDGLGKPCVCPQRRGEHGDGLLLRLHRIRSEERAQTTRRVRPGHYATISGADQAMQRFGRLQLEPPASQKPTDTVELRST